MNLIDKNETLNEMGMIDVTERKTDGFNACIEAVESMPSISKLYVVTADGWNRGYGAEIYLVGVFSDREKATQAVKNDYYNITEVELDEEYPLIDSCYSDEDLRNENYLGGYVE